MTEQTNGRGSLEGLTAIVTGAAKGIGLGIAQDLAAHGCKVVLWDMDEAALRQAADSIGGSARTGLVDVSSVEQVEAAVAEALKDGGKVDILVNNAGINGNQLVTQMGIDAWKKVIDVNLTSQFICTKAVLPGMMERRFGRIINLSSRAWLGNRGQASYSASKGGIVSFTRTLALEYARYGITANAIAPGIIETPLFATLREDVAENLKQGVPMQRIGQPEDIANAVRFFADPAASYVTGQLIYVCGGRSLSSPSV